MLSSHGGLMSTPDARWEFFIRLAMEDELELDPTLVADKTSVIYRYLNQTVDASKKRNISGVASNLMEMRSFVIERGANGKPGVQPESLSPEFVDFLTDENMWSWIGEASKKTNFTSYDSQACEMVMKEINFLLTDDKIINNELNQLKTAGA